ncbi:hypothetical protein MKZ38_010440 [Zalerion maritima]|uniref:SPRY domain-containing protein n=1 Tax=Zalerion maritima TaxID=339359 RepID=A0AAD5RT67_9PEZI|nr:hypothetical protein MKZ38_010440 [Zalerion maritima]
MNNNNNSFAPPAGPPPGYQQQDSYAPPPPGPPPNQGQQQYAPPSGAPPGHQSSGDYAPPPGPPPSQQYASPPGPPPFSGNYAPPLGPPPGQQQPPKHDWESAVPDTALLPPPPSFFSGRDASPVSNATKEEADQGEEWCERFPIMEPPMVLDNSADMALRSYNFYLTEPAFWKNSRNKCEHNSVKNSWHIHTRDSRDSSMLSYPPLYVVNSNSPYPGQPPTMIYYEVKFSDTCRFDDESTVALGFSTLPYPAFRLPGWHRGSLACHGDDGLRYINDFHGGKDFPGYPHQTVPFKRNSTVGMGMVFTPGSSRLEVQVFQTRDGNMFGSWDLHEELDAVQDKPVTGLEGKHDLAAAIGVCGKSNFEVFLHPSQWKFDHEAWRARGFK